MVHEARIVNECIFTVLVNLSNNALIHCHSPPSCLEFQEENMNYFVWHVMTVTRYNVWYKQVRVPNLTKLSDVIYIQTVIHAAQCTICILDQTEKSK